MMRKRTYLALHSSTKNTLMPRPSLSNTLQWETWDKKEYFIIKGEQANARIILRGDNNRRTHQNWLKTLFLIRKTKTNILFNDYAREREIMGNSEDEQQMAKLVRSFFKKFRQDGEKRKKKWERVRERERESNTERKSAT